VVPEDDFERDGWLVAVTFAVSGKQSMTTATLSTDLNRLPPTARRNEMTGCETGAVIKGQRLWRDRPWSPCLAATGRGKFFVPSPKGVSVRAYWGSALRSNVFAGNIPETPRIDVAPRENR